MHSGLEGPSLVSQTLAQRQRMRAVVQCSWTGIGGHPTIPTVDLSAWPFGFFVCLFFVFVFARALVHMNPGAVHFECSGSVVTFGGHSAGCGVSCTAITQHRYLD